MTAPSVAIHDFRPEYAESVNRIAVAAFEQFSSEYDNWDRFRENIARMSDLSSTAEVLVATLDSVPCGAVGYVPPGAPKADYFNQSWPIIRLLVVDPAARGRGIGRKLTQACIDRAYRDGARCIALHTSPIMTTALPLYLRMGFEFKGPTPSIHGVEYGLYVKTLI